MDETELAFAGIPRQAEFLRARQISSNELVELNLARIERINPKLNAFTDVFGEEARAAAAHADRRLGRCGIRLRRAGSIRIPAVCNGLFGLKPQRDWISLAGIAGATLTGG